MRLVTRCAILASTLMACGGPAAKPASPVGGSDPAPVATGPADPAGDAPTSAHPLAGSWRGATDSGPLFLVLEAASSGAQLSGSACAAAGTDCKPLEKVTFSEGTLQFQCRWPEGDKAYQVTARLVLTPSGDTLDGGLHTTKCGCTQPARLVRVP
jgi:hypothetical protein